MPDSNEMIVALEERAERRNERRDFFKAAIGAAAVGASATALSFSTAASAQEVTDADVLNFALNLEYLEANFYSYAVFGTPIAASLTDGVGALGRAVGGSQVDFKDKLVKAYAYEIANDEIAHVNFLRTALGAARVAQPRVDVGFKPMSAFSVAARAAGLIGEGETFNPYASDENFLLGAYIFEDVGVTAYKGAAPLITNATFLEAAAGILAVEAYHAAVVRTTLYRKGIDAPALIEATEKISAARDSLDGSTSLDQGVANRPTGRGMASNIVPLDENGIAYSRSTGQVLNIVYLNNLAVMRGGFFPNGVNGLIKTSAAN